MTKASAGALDQACQFIDEAYARLSEAGGLVVRDSQVELSKAIATCLLDNVPLAAEAPTGTGKTLAYLIGALAAARALGGARPMPVVVATATKAMQDQIVLGDFPKLVRAGLAYETDAVLMKGKSSYVCLRDLRQLHDQLEEHGDDSELLPGEVGSFIGSKQLAALLSLYEAGSWEGELDQVRGLTTTQTRGIAVNSDTCSKRRCPDFHDCAYFKAKERVQLAPVVVTNQDLLLRDLALSNQSDNATFDIPDYIAVVDEAHRLADKALAVGSSDVSLVDVLGALHKLPGLRAAVCESPLLRQVAGAVSHDFDPSKRFDSREALVAAQELDRSLAEIQLDGSSQQRFAGAVIPAPVHAAAARLHALLSALKVPLGAFVQHAKDSDAGFSVESQQGRLLADAVRRASTAFKPLNTAELGLSRFLNKGLRGVRWLTRDEHGASLHFSPLEGAQVLRPLLWNATRARPVLLSATMRGLDDFGRFARSSGLPDSARRLVLPHVFDYEKSKLVVVAMRHSPKLSEREAFVDELGGRLLERVRPGEGTLVILPSWVVLKEVAPRLRQHFGDSFVKVQGERPLKDLLESHKRDIDQGAGSVLVGLTTVAEGLDLPGAYCVHVCIAALPFSVPDSPLEREVAEMLGNRYFGERSLPQATLALIQEVGRLVRREADSGVVSVFDHRLGSTAYGKKMLKALPPFIVDIERSPA